MVCNHFSTACVVAFSKRLFFNDIILYTMVRLLAFSMISSDAFIETHFLPFLFKMFL